MTVQEAKKIMEMFLHKQCDLQRTEFAYSQNEVWDAVKMSADALEEVEQYRALGTVEELKEAREKQLAKKPNIVGGEFIKLAECSECNTVIRFKQEYCHKCGNKVNWEEGETSD